MPRDRRHLLHWAAKGTHDDYDKLRRHAKKVQHRVPSYIDSKHVGAIAEQGSRRHLAENVHESTFLDGLAWLIDQVPGGRWSWAKNLTQGALKPFRGDAITEEDELYALLIDQAYKDEPRDAMGQWTRNPELGSDYVQVYDNVDGHRYIAVRGTKLHGPGARRRGEPDWRRAAADPRRDPAGHRRGRGWALALDQPHRQGVRRQQRAAGPDPADLHVQPRLQPRGAPQRADERVRWFIDLLDPVSLGDMGSAGPKNAVYRTTFGWNPIGPHSLTAWAGEVAAKDVTPTQEKENVVSQQRDEVPTQGMGDAFGDGGLLDFGTDNWDAAAFGL